MLWHTSTVGISSTAYVDLDPQLSQLFTLSKTALSLLFAPAKIAQTLH